MNKLALVSTILTTTLLASTGAAAPQAASGAQVMSRSVPWPAGVGGSGAFGRTVIGRFLDDTMGVAVVLRGSTAVAVVEPHAMTAFFEVSSRALNDVARFPADVGQEALVAVSPTGLFHYSYTSDPGAFVELSLGSAIWQGATRVLVADLDANGERDILGVSSAGNTLLALHGDGTGGWTESTVTVDAVILDLVVNDFVAGGLPEIVAHTTNGLRVYDGAGSTLYTTTAPGTTGAVATVESDGESPSTGVAWVHPNVPGTLDLVEHVDSSDSDTPTALGVPIPPMVEPTAFDVYAAVTADWNGDGLDDLLTPHTTLLRAALFLNQGSPKHFKRATLGADYELFDLAAEPNQGGSGASIYGFADLDGSGNAEVVAPIDVNQQITVVGNPTATQLATSTVSGADQSSVVGFFSDKSYYDYAQPNDGTLALVLESVPSALRTNFAYMQVIEWSQPDPRTSPTPLDAEARRNDLYAFAPGASSSPRLYVDVPFDHNEYGGVQSWGGRHAYLQLRFVNVDDPSAAVPTITEFSHSIIVGVTIDGVGNTSTSAYMLGLPGVVGEVDLEQGTFPFNDGSLNGVGAVVVLNQMPSFTSGTSPRPKRPTIAAGEVNLW